MYKILTTFACIMLFHIMGNAQETISILGPKDHETINELRPTLRWQHFPGAHHYLLRWFEIDPITGSVLKTKQNIITDKTEYKMEEDLVSNRRYQWNVDAYNDKKTEIASSCPEFLTGNISKEEIKKWGQELTRKKLEIEKKIGIESSNSGPPSTYGIRVDSVRKDSPAEKSSLRRGDIIVECNGEKVNKIDDLFKYIDKKPLWFKFERIVDVQQHQ